MALPSPHTTRAVKALAVVIAMGLLGLGIVNAMAVAPGTPEFERIWARTDKPVADGAANRTWMWGPEANTGVIPEQYAESPGGARQVQYYDKARMEITNPAAVDDGVWYVTNGLLVNELVSGRVQIGDALFQLRQPADSINVAGDLDDPNGPTYGTIGAVLDQSPLAEGAPITQRLARDGTISEDPSLLDEGVTAAYRVQATGIDHQVASPFWEFMTSRGTVYEDGELVDDLLFQNAFYATGYPISEAYWAAVKVKGTVQDVLLQCFERRCLTYTPGNEEGWQVEAGNVGQHYYRWRYPDELPTPPTTTVSSTPTNPPTNTATSTPANTPTSTTPTAPLPDERLIAASMRGVNATTEASGSTSFYIQEDGSGIDYQINVTGLVNVTAAHMHAGGEEEDGNILVPLFIAGDGTSVTPDGVLAEGTIEDDDLPDGMTIVELANLMVDGEVYVDVHTTANPTGAIRGQTEPLDAATTRATLSGESVIPPVMTDASGAALFNYDAGLQAIAYQIALNEIEGLTIVDIHAGAANENGPVLASLFVASAPIPSYSDVLASTITADTLTNVTIEELVYLMLTGDAYIDVHTSVNPGGAIRGQIAVGLSVA